MEMIPIKFTLKSIFTSGTFGPVLLGMTIEEVTALLGNPGSEHDFDVDHYLTKILFYENYEFKFQSFYDDSSEYKLAGIQNDHIKYVGAIENGFDSDKVILDPWFFKSTMTLDEVKTSLNEEGLEYSLEQKYEVLFIKFQNGSDIFFEQKDLNWVCWGWSFNPGNF